MRRLGLECQWFYSLFPLGFLWHGYMLVTLGGVWNWFPCTDTVPTSSSDSGAWTRIQALRFNPHFSVLCIIILADYVLVYDPFPGKTRQVNRARTPLSWVS